jgi:hypothetical protein
MYDNRGVDQHRKETGAIMTRTRLTRLLLWCTGVFALSLPALAVPLLLPKLPRAYAGGCGLEWRVVVSPNHGNIDNRLYGVEAITENAVWATGTDDAGFASHSLFLRWNGSTWAEIQSPNPSSFYNYFFALGATSPDNVWSMGHYGNTSSSNLMIARLAGNLWSRVTIPTVAATLNYRYGDLAAISDTDVWAVSYQAGAQVTTTLTLHGDGNTFNIVPSPNVGSFNNYLSGVAEVEPNYIWAGGAYSNGAAYRTLTMRWDGTQWNIVPSPQRGHRRQRHIPHVRLVLGQRMGGGSLYGVTYHYQDTGSSVGRRAVEHYSWLEPRHL